MMLSLLLIFSFRTIKKKSIAITSVAEILGMEASNYIIYEVLHNGIPIYIGSGLPDRYLHAKSGASHIPALNKLYFEDGDNMIVNILRDGLTKEESLEYEKEYIQAIKPEMNTIHTGKPKVVSNGTKQKTRRKSFRSKS